VSGLPRLGVAVILIRGDRLLVMRRATPPFLGAWAGVEGAVESGESALGAALRETREETGIVPDGLRALAPEPRRVETERGPVALHVFVGFVADGTEAVLNEEHSEHAWLELGPALERLSLESARRAFAEAYERFVPTPSGAPSRRS
jgi:ADP-ribose pyrophosphatase YjhB (NUDIX family)